MKTSKISQLSSEELFKKHQKDPETKSMNPFLMTIEEAKRENGSLSREIIIEKKKIDEVFLKPIRIEFKRY